VREALSGLRYHAPMDAPLRLAVAQIAPVLLDRDATLAKVLERVHEAGEARADLVCFGEALVPAYPVWTERTDGARFEGAAGKELHARYVDQAVTIEAGHLDALCETARARRVAVQLGIIERPSARGQSLYCASVHVDATGAIRSAHRKLVPTFEERLSWAPGDGHGLVVHELGAFRVGALNCWENWMPLARAALQAQGETLHVMHWPGCRRNTEPVTRFLAREGRSFAVSACGLLRAEDVPADLPYRARIAPEPGELLLDGGSCVAGPDGEWLLEPVVGEECLRVVELDPALVRRERQNFDPAGHYARPDVLRLCVDRRRQTVADFDDGSSS